jgi:hypothetical protein
MAHVRKTMAHVRKTMAHVRNAMVHVRKVMAHVRNAVPLAHKAMQHVHSRIHRGFGKRANWQKTKIKKILRDQSPEMLVQPHVAS